MLLISYFKTKEKNTIKYQTFVVNLFNHKWQGLSVSTTTHQTIKDYFYFSLQIIKGKKNSKYQKNQKFLTLNWKILRELKKVENVYIQ